MEIKTGGEFVFMRNFVLILSLLLASCSSEAQNTNSETEQIEEVVTADRIEPDPISTVDPQQFLQISDQLNYVLPVTESDVLSELTIIIEAETGEPSDLSQVKNCYEDYKSGSSQYNGDADFSSVAKDYYSNQKYKPTTIEQISAVSAQHYSACLGIEKECPGTCLHYAAANAVTIGRLSIVGEGDAMSFDNPELDAPGQ